MKKTKAEIFRINSPYGVIIRLSDLTYSWFNRNYKEVYNDSRDFLSWKDLYGFKNKLKDETIVEKIKDFASKNRDFGTSSAIEKEEGSSYLRVWLYNDKNFPFNSSGEIKSKMNQYLRKKTEIKSILL